MHSIIRVLISATAWAVDPDLDLLLGRGHLNDLDVCIALGLIHVVYVVLHAEVASKAVQVLSSFGDDQLLGI